MSFRLIPARGTSCQSCVRPARSLLLVAVTATGVCVSLDCGTAPSGDVGVTPGGQQDIAAARAAIEDGGTPDPESITVEGFLSEHSIPIEEPAGAGLLYTTASVAWNGDFDVFTPVATVVVGFGTTIDPDQFERDALNLCLVIDRSGSMGDPIDRRTGTAKLDGVKIAIDRLLAQLDGDDRVSIVGFNGQASVLLSPVPGDDLASIKGAYDTLEAQGGTDLARGMRRAYRLLRDHRSTARSDRLIVFTDAQLTRLGERKVQSFLETMEEYATQGIGASVFGIGTDFGHEVAYEVSQIRGGNYFFLSDYDRIVTVFDEEFDYLVTPVATDVLLEVSVPFEFDVVAVFGIPVEETLPHLLELNIPTLFLSARQGGGAIMVRARPGALVNLDEGNTVARITLSYKRLDGTEETHPLQTTVLPGGLDAGSEESYFETEGTQRAVLLLNTALVLHHACEDLHRDWDHYDYYSYDRGRAIERLTEFLPYFDGMAEGLEDLASEASRSLSQERTLVEQLLTNIRDW